MLIKLGENMTFCFFLTEKQTTGFCVASFAVTESE